MELLLALEGVPSLGSNPLKRMAHSGFSFEHDRINGLARTGLAAGDWQGISTGA